MFTSVQPGEQMMFLEGKAWLPLQQVSPLPTPAARHLHHLQP